MNLKDHHSQFWIKKKRNWLYQRSLQKIQAEIESYKDVDDEEKRDTIQAQDVLMLDRISI